MRNIMKLRLNKHGQWENVYDDGFVELSAKVTINQLLNEMEDMREKIIEEALEYDSDYTKANKIIDYIKGLK